MPVSVASRYYRSPVYSATKPDLTRHPTIAIRPPTPPPAGTLLYSHTVTGLETIEYLAWRYYGDSKLWWRLAEANAPQFPLDLPAGASLSVPATNDLGTIVRTRSFA
jgi:hypothetical protein